MARPIRETPIWEGEDAKRFIERMGETRIESADRKKRRLNNYQMAISILKNQ